MKQKQHPLLPKDVFSGGYSPSFLGLNALAKLWQSWMQPAWRVGVSGWIFIIACLWLGWKFNFHWSLPRLLGLSDWKLSFLEASQQFSFYALFMLCLCSVLSLKFLGAEKTRACQALIKRHYPGVCLVKDVYHLLKTVPEASSWNARRLRIAESIPCCVHPSGRPAICWLSDSW